MNPHRQTRVAASGGVLLALVGLFIGHTLEYLRVWGPAGIVASMTNPVHAYMLPVAGVLLALGAVFGLRLARAWERLNARLDRAAAGVRRILHGRTADVPGDRAPRSSSGTRLAAIWLPLATVQTALYVVQENIEAVARSQPAPGLGAITGIHWAAPFVHLYVSLLLACVVRICEILFRRREVAVERLEALLRAVAGRRRTAAPATPRPVARTVSPLDRLGRHLWRRPPPLLLDA
ncbi:MAG: hypothetical protein WB793_03615 [Candidatus Dormiibacterota bacterium]